MAPCSFRCLNSGRYPRCLRENRDDVACLTDSIPCISFSTVAKVRHFRGRKLDFLLERHFSNGLVEPLFGTGIGKTCASRGGSRSFFGDGADECRKSRRNERGFCEPRERRKDVEWPARHGGSNMRSLSELPSSARRCEKTFPKRPKRCPKKLCHPRRSLVHRICEIVIVGIGILHALDPPTNQ